MHSPKPPGAIRPPAPPGPPPPLFAAWLDHSCDRMISGPLADRLIEQVRVRDRQIAKERATWRYKIKVAPVNLWHRLRNRLGKWWRC